MDASREASLAADGAGRNVRPVSISVSEVGEGKELRAWLAVRSELEPDDIPGETGIEERDAWCRVRLDAAAEGAAVAVDETVVGFAGLHELAGQGLYEQRLLAVLPQYRRRGIARTLKIAQLEWLQEQGAPCRDLECRDEPCRAELEPVSRLPSDRRVDRAPRPRRRLAIPAKSMTVLADNAFVGRRGSAPAGALFAVDGAEPS